MRRVRNKRGLQLSNNPRKTCNDIVIETFSEAILRPKFDLANYDEELCRKIVGFFMDHYDEIFTPPVILRRVVEDKVNIKDFLIMIVDGYSKDLNDLLR